MASRVDRLPSLGLPENLSDDASLILDACKALRQCKDHDNTVFDDSIIAPTTHTVVESLSDNALLKLPLITWYFNGSMRSDAYSSAPSAALGTLKINL